MDKFIIIRVDGSFPKIGSDKLLEALSSGYKIIDKTAMERYITYVLELQEK